MGSFNDYSASPTVFYPSQQHTYHTLSYDRSFASIHSSFSNNGQQMPPRPPFISNPSRKRSRDEVDDEASNYLTHFDVPESKTREPSPIYGEGMMLVNPSTGRAIAAESQTGTWYEEQLEEERRATAKAEAQLKEDMEARNRPAKCQRLDVPPDPPVHSKVELLTYSRNPPELYASPAINAVSVMLGVGWSAISSEEHTQSAARGWAKYIENHYPSLNDVEILLKSEGRQAYLVRARDRIEGLYLFSEDLNDGRLVAHDWESCIRKLRVSEVDFDGREAMRAVRTPIIATSDGMDGVQDMGLNGTASAEEISAAVQSLDSMDID